MFSISTAFVLSASLLVGQANAHIAAYAKGMYCANGYRDGAKMSGYDAMNSNTPVTPLYQLSYSDWWFHGVTQCPSDPPPAGEFLELPAGKSFMVEMGSNRGKTSLSFNGQYTSDWPDGEHYPEDYHVDSCIISPNLHTKNLEGAAGTAFAISYESDINNVNPDNLAVFSVRYHTPWKRETWYDVPAAMPACPEGGCICAWGWIPNGCGQPNMYHQAFKCQVTGASSSTPVAKPQPPVWCEDDPSKCVKGSKQMLYWHQAERNNIEVKGVDKAGQAKSPAYNDKCGFAEGAQNDIFDGAAMPTGGGGSSSGSKETAGSNQGNSDPAAPASSNNGGTDAGAAAPSYQQDNTSSNNEGSFTNDSSPVSEPQQQQQDGQASSSPTPASAAQSSSQQHEGRCAARKRSIDTRAVRRHRAAVSRL